MKNATALVTALFASTLAGCGGGSGGSGSPTRAVLTPPASEGVGWGFNQAGEPVFGVQIPTGLRTYTLNHVRRDIPVTGLPTTFNCAYGNLIVAFAQGTGTFYVVRADGFKRLFAPARFVGTDGDSTILVGEAGGYSLYDARTDTKTSAPVPSGDNAWGFSGGFIGGQEGDGGPGKRAYILPASGGSPTYLAVPANTTQVLPQVVLPDGRSIGAAKAADGSYFMLAWSAAGAYTPLGASSPDPLVPVGYATDGTYCYVRHLTGSQQSFVVLPGGDPIAAESLGVPAGHSIQALSANGQYFFAGSADGNTPLAYRTR